MLLHIKFLGREKGKVKFPNLTELQDSFVLLSDKIPDYFCVLFFFHTICRAYTFYYMNPYNINIINIKLY